MNRKEKTEKISANILLILILIIVTLLIVATGCHNECIHENTQPKNTIDKWNNHVDSVLKNKIKEEYHGKEGKSEYGEYIELDSVTIDGVRYLKGTCLDNE
tara:strand:+ start:397 stop:699 length:303 start_codon:yes stop_codon:yes gene_type:complete